MQWTREERAFALETYFSCGRLISATQHAFRNHFNIEPGGRVPDRKSILLWVDSFRETGDVQRKKPGGARTVRTPENIKQVWQSILQSPGRSARQHAAALGISDRSVRRILHEFKNHHNRELKDIPMFHDSNNFSNSSFIPVTSGNNPAASTSSFTKQSTDGDDDRTNSFVLKTEELEIDHDPNDPDLEQDDMEDDHPERGCSDSTRDLTETENNFQSDENNDRFECFGKYISSLLRDLPEIVSYHLQEAITRQVLEAHIANQSSSLNNHLYASKVPSGKQPNIAYHIPHHFP